MTNPAATSRRIPASSAWLMLSAAVLLVLIFVQVGRSTSASTTFTPRDAAFAGMMGSDVVSRVGDYSMLTLDVSNSEDLLVILDGHGEDLYAYRVVGKKTVDYLQKAKLPDIFQSCKNLTGNR